MAWALYYLSHNPNIQQKLREEIMDQLHGQEPDYNNIQSLNLCQNIIKETLRLRPVVPIFTRISATEQVLNNYTVKPHVRLTFLSSFGKIIDPIK